MFWKNFGFYLKIAAVSSSEILIPPTKLHGVISLKTCIQYCRENFKSYILIIITHQKVDLNLGTTHTALTDGAQ